MFSFLGRSLQLRLLTVMMRGFLLLLTLASTAVFADRVSPSERVSESTNIRAAPSASSASLGVLRLGESLELLGSVPWWYKVRLPGGEVAFVSKAWNQVVSESPPVPVGTEYTVHVVDVGTGLGIYVQGPDFNLIYDAGSMDDRKVGDRNRFVAYLKAIAPALTTIDHLVLSHPHQDHIVLMPDIMTEYEVSHVWDSGAGYNSCVYRTFIDAVRMEGTQYHTSTKNFGTHEKTFEPTTSGCGGLGDSFSLNHGSEITTDPVSLGLGATMNFLYINAEKHSDVNENSLVVRLDLADRRILFMGDAEAGKREDPASAPDSGSIESILLTCCTPQLKADVMVVGHHGSMTSSRGVFLDAVDAEHYVISSGPFPYKSVTLPDESVRQALQSRASLHETTIDDEGCKGNALKIGFVETNADKQRPGGCTNIQVKVTTGAPITVSSFPL